MNKLTGIVFGTPPAARCGVSARPVEAHIPNLRRERLIGVWTRDPTTNRLVCTWRRPATADNLPAGDAAEPPSYLQLAA